MKTVQRSAAKSPGSLVQYIVVGASIGFLILCLDRLILRWQIAIVLGLLAVLVGAIVYDRDKVFRFLLAFLGLVIPLNIHLSIFDRPHIGTPGIEISLSIIITFLLFLMMVYERVLIAETHFEFNKVLILPVLAYMLAGTLSLLNAEHPDLVGLELIRIVTLLGVMLVIMNLKDDKEIRLFVLFLLIGFVMQSVVACAQYLADRPLGLGRFGEGELVSQDMGRMVSRAGGTIGHPNILAYYLEMLLPVAFGLTLVESNAKMLTCLMGTLGLGLAALVATLSRAGWLTVPVSFSIVVVLSKARLFRLSTVPIWFLAGCLLSGILYFSFPLIEKRLTYDDYDSAANRMPMNEATLSIIERFPIVGAGLNNFPEFFHKYDTTGKSRVLVEKLVVHNLFLWVWAETGIIGLLAFFWMFGSVFFVIGRLLSQLSPWHRGLLTGIGAGLFAHLIHALVDPGFRVNLATSVLVYTLIGLVGAVSIQHRREKNLLKSGVTKDSSEANSQWAYKDIDVMPDQAGKAYP